MCGVSVPELKTFDPSVTTLTRPPSPPSPGISRPLPPLLDPQDGTFLCRPDHMAGRQVCITLYAKSTSREARESAWRSRERQVSMIDLGRAAKALELASINWRELVTHEDILTAAETLCAPGATH